MLFHANILKCTYLHRPYLSVLHFWFFNGFTGHLHSRAMRRRRANAETEAPMNSTSLYTVTDSVHAASCLVIVNVGRYTCAVVQLMRCRPMGYTQLQIPERGSQAGRGARRVSI